MKVLLTTLVVMLLAASAGPAGAASRSGLRGTVLLDPGYPVCKVGTSCTRPAAHIVLKFWRKGRVVAHTRSDGNGRFRIALRPRTYDVSWGKGGVLSPGRVTVATDRYRRLTCSDDCGIRQERGP